MRMPVYKWIERGKDLPVLTGAVADLLNLSQGDDSDASQVAEVIKRDVSLSTAVLRISNSSIYGFPAKIANIDQAVVVLGLNSLRNIALGVGVLNLWPPNNNKDFLSKTWQRSLITGIAARGLCNVIGLQKREDAFTGGLLHDIGLIALFSYDPERTSDLLKILEHKGRIPLDDEKKIMGIDHVEAGRLLVKRWNLPENLVLAVKCHHDEPHKDLCAEGDGNFAQIAYLGSLVGDIFYLGRKRLSIQTYISGCQTLFGISPDQSDLLLQNVYPQLVEIAEQFNIAVGTDAVYYEMIRKANEEIASIALSNEATKHQLLQAFKREKKLTAQLEEVNRKLKKTAAQDGLTGLFNRQFLDEMLQKEWNRSKRYGYPVSVVMSDIDNFKVVNDTYGHQKGDSVLKKIAEILTREARASDLVARYGGEEFAMILPQTELEDAVAVAERFRSAVQKLQISSGDRGYVSVTLSCGVSTAYPTKGDHNLEGLIREADKALYQAKESGKNKVFSMKFKPLVRLLKGGLDA